VQARLADMLTEITKAQLLSIQLGRMKERGTMKPSRSRSPNATTARSRSTSRARHATSSVPTASPPSTRSCATMCNLESVKTYEGTHNIHTLVLGEAITGVPAYR